MTRSYKIARPFGGILRRVHTVQLSERNGMKRPNHSKIRTALSLLALVAAPVLAQQSLPEAAKPAPDKKTGAMPGSLSMCVGCHGIPLYQTAFPEVYHVPMIAGQSPQYIINALRAYKAGDRPHPTMQGIAKSLSENDMAALAEYYGSGVHGGKK
jgi:cytochrome c553